MFFLNALLNAVIGNNKGNNCGSNITRQWSKAWSLRSILESWLHDTKVEGTEGNLMLILINKQLVLTVLCFRTRPGDGPLFSFSLPTGWFTLILYFTWNFTLILYFYLKLYFVVFQAITCGKMTGKLWSVDSQEIHIFLVGKRWNLIRLMQ